MKIIYHPFFTRNPVAYSLLFLILIMTGLGQTAAAKTSSESSQQSAVYEITLESLQNKIESLKAREGIDEELKTRILKLYQKAVDNLGNLQWFEFQTNFFQDALKQVPERIKQRQALIDRNSAKPAIQKPTISDNISKAELKQLLVIERGKLSQLETQLQKLNNDLTEQNNRPQQIRQETIIAKQSLESAQNNLISLRNASDSKLEIEARQLYLKTLIEMHTAELNMLEIEAISNPLRTQLIKTELQFSNQQQKNLAALIKSIDDELFERQQTETEKMHETLTLAEMDALNKHPVIQSAAHDNFEYNRRQQDITVKIELYDEKKQHIKTLSAQIDEEFKSAEKKINLAGLSPALGKILREQRRNLPTYAQFYKPSQKVQNETALTSLELLTIEDLLKQFADPVHYLQQMMDKHVDHTLPKRQRMKIQTELTGLLAIQKDLLGKLNTSYTSYLRMLGDFDFAKRQMLNQADKYAAYLDKRLLWVPSSSPVSFDYFAKLYRSLEWLTLPSNWRQVTQDLSRIITGRPFLGLSGLLGFFVLLGLRPGICHQLTLIKQQVTKLYTDKFHYTVQALLYSILLVLPFPILLNFLSWLLSNDLHALDFSKAVGVGLRAASVPLFFIQLFYLLFAPEGIVRKHLLWQEESVTLLRRQIAWARFLAVPAIFIIATTGAYQITLHSDTLGRLALISTMLAMSYILARILQPQRGVLQGHMQQFPDGWLYRLRYAWYPGIICIPLIIAGFAVAGYYLSALELQQKSIITLRLFFITAIIHQLVIRWLTLANRQLALKNARQKRKAAEFTAQQTTSSEEPHINVDEQLLDIPKITSQTRRLLDVLIAISLLTGTWFIWRNILPAFSFLDNVALWQQTVIIDNQEVYRPITLTNLLLAGLYIFITAVTVRNFSGVMEVFVFRRLAMESGSRYAINQLAQYTLIAIGFIFIANELGGSWAKVQWLVAALGVGLGFGLQEIFANLVSGIILLFERPIRIGDTVTVGDITGKVSRIQMRATRIIDWDQKELIVPNKTFITDQLINWSLSDQVTRLVIPVGIAYGSDVELAHQVITEAVTTTPQVLSEPEPCVYFLGFGDSSLDFSIRAYVSELGNRLPVTHDLHVRINQALREHQIEIPFPQRDIHVRSMVRTS